MTVAGVGQAGMDAAGLHAALGYLFSSQSEITPVGVVASLAIVLGSVVLWRQQWALARSMTLMENEKAAAARKKDDGPAAQRTEQERSERERERAEFEPGGQQETSLPVFRRGDTVAVIGLEGERALHNGKGGMVVACNRYEETCTVRMFGKDPRTKEGMWLDTPLTVTPANLMISASPHPSSPGRGPQPPLLPSRP